jgi:pyruvate dehydrogenase phosphatase
MADETHFTKLNSDSDDLTVEVIFFGNGDRSGNVTLNREASAPLNDLKAKL